MIKRIISFSFLVLFTTIIISQESYYTGVNLNLTGITLKQELATKITSTHTNKLFYTPDIWQASILTDPNPTNSSEVILIYGWEDGTDSDVTNDLYRDNTLQDAGSGASFVWNREHVFSQSRAIPKLSTDDPGPGTDAHNLRPADRTRNTSRNNRKFTIGTGNSGITSNGDWYPGDAWKGDVARIVMYMYVRYNGDGSRISETQCLPSNIGIGSNAATPDNMLDLFLQWNAEDPVSDLERNRNTYHENTTDNTYAQGNRNPFIDNPRLATRIWGGPKAEDSWGIYTSTDTEAPTTPNDIVAANITTYSFDISWAASKDNVDVTSYDVFLDGNLQTNTTTTSTTIIGLNSNTTYTVSVLAKDIANNTSQQSSAIHVSTLVDNAAPSIPTDIVISNETGTSFKTTWSASTDNTAVTAYDIFINGTLNASTDQTSFTVTGLNNSTTYSVQVLAKDAVDNKSSLSNAVNGTTTDGTTTTANELFFSEYVEGSSSNKALEIANVTSANIDLSIYSIKRQSDGGNNGTVWDNTLTLSDVIMAGDVYVIVNGGASLPELQSVTNGGQADFEQPNASETNWGAPINFNGNDPVGLFKNDVLIDIIGVYNGGSANFAKDKTLRRKVGVIQPNTAFDIDNEWDILAKDTVDDIGKHNATLKVNAVLLDGFRIYPNPVETILKIKNPTNKLVKSAAIYSLLGKKILSVKNPSEEINIELLSKGIYILKLQVENNSYSIKIVKK